MRPPADADRLAFLNRRGGRLVAAAASGVLMFFAFGLSPCWPLAWIAPIPLLLAAPRARGREAAGLAAGAGLVGALSLARYYVEVTRGVGPVLLLLHALVWCLVVVGARHVLVSSNHWSVVLAYPAMWAGLDTILSTLSPHGTAGSIAYSQMNALPVIQVAALAGTAGIVFTLSLLPSIVAVAAYHGRRLQRPRLAYALPGGVLLAILGYGGVRLATAPAVPAIPVGLAVRDAPLVRVEGSGLALDFLWREYADAVRSLAERGARIVVLPEKIGVVEAADAERVQAVLRDAASKHGVYVLAGVVVRDPGGVHNRAWLFDPARPRLIADYSKQHLIPGLEDAFTPGRDDVVRAADGNVVGIAICKDLDFAALGRRYAALGAGAMLVPAWDFERDAWLHSRMAMLRGVESGFTVVRAAKNGVLTVSDRYGRVLAETRSGATRMAVLDAAAPLPPAFPTVYGRIGDLAGWLGVAAGALLLLRAISPARAAAPPVPPPPPPRGGS